ncbi:hypothetical protein AGIG_G12927 [Arapaima gigas]
MLQECQKTFCWPSENVWILDKSIHTLTFSLIFRVSLSPPIECSSARQLTIWPHQLSAETTLLRDTVPHGARVYSCHDRALEPDHSCH